MSAPAVAAARSMTGAATGAGPVWILVAGVVMLLGFAAFRLRLALPVRSLETSGGCPWCVVRASICGDMRCGEDRYDQLPYAHRAPVRVTEHWNVGDAW